MHKGIWPVFIPQHCGGLSIELQGTVTTIFNLLKTFAHLLGIMYNWPDDTWKEIKEHRWLNKTRWHNQLHVLTHHLKWKKELIWTLIKRFTNPVPLLSGNFLLIAVIFYNNKSEVKLGKLGINRYDFLRADTFCEHQRDEENF